MVCPNCGNEVMVNTTLCDKCGADLSGITTADAKENNSVPTCKKCGGAIKPGAKFCLKCGKPLDTKGLGQKVRFQNWASSLKADASKGKKNNSKGIKAVCIIVALIVIAGIAGGVLWKKNNLGIASKEDIFIDLEAASEECSEPSVESVTEEINFDADKLFAEADALTETMKNRMNEDAEIINVMDGLVSVIDTYIAVAEEAGNIRLAESRVENVYGTYIEAVNKHKDMMSRSTLSGVIYAQIMLEFDAAITLGNELKEKGYEVDLSEIEVSEDEFDKSYREQMINTFDEFTTRDAWSRTESWNLMKDTVDNMFDPTDLDNPLRLRYAYALAWWTQKQIETEIASGLITEKGAAIKIAGLLELMDYNPMMIHYYIQYMEVSGEDCSTVAVAYNEIVQRIKETQGIEIGRDVDIACFWYFNDINEPTDRVRDGSTNGVTSENRNWIRKRMGDVEFINQ